MSIVTKLLSKLFCCSEQNIHYKLMIKYKEKKQQFVIISSTTTVKK